MESERRNSIFVIGEIQKQTLPPLTFELLYAAHCLGKAIQAEVSVILMGNGMAEEAKRLCKYPADEVIYLECPPFQWVHSDMCCQAVLPVLRERQPELILVGATAFGRLLGSGLAWHLHTELITDASRIWYHEETAKIIVTRPAFDGKRMADFSVLQRPAIVSVRQGMMPKASYKERQQGKFIQIVPGRLSLQEGGLRWIADVFRQEEDRELARASIIVSGGRGLKGKEGFKLLEILAARLGGEVGSTRPCVDAGWTVPSQQVGQSGIAVKPKLYMAFGISGAIQHMTGIEAEKMIAVNSDPKAAIFRYCDYGIVGDAREILKTMIEKIRYDR